MAIPFVLATGSLALSAAGAYAAYQGNRAQASMGVQSARLRQEQASTEAELARLQAREQENERLRKAEISRAAGIASAASSGFDWWASPTAQSLDNENDRIVAGDISSIRLLGAARQRRALLEGRGAAMLEESYSTMGRNAWIQPTARLLGSARESAGIIASSFGGAPSARPDPNTMAPNWEPR